MPAVVSGKDKNKKELSVSVPEYLVNALAAVEISKSGNMPAGEAISKAKSAVRLVIKGMDKPNSYEVCRAIFMSVCKPSVSRGMVDFEERLDTEIQSDIEDYL